MNISHLKREAYKARIADLESALELALALLIKLEPPDSRAVSDHFVAMAAIHAGGDIVNDEARQIVKVTLEKLNEEDQTEAHLRETWTWLIGDKDAGPQLNEAWARKESIRLGLNPDDICADGGITTWLVVLQEAKTKRGIA